MKQLSKAMLGLLRGQGGISLLETMVALGILGLIGAAFMAALSTTSTNTELHEERVIAASLAQSQIELIKQAPYDDTVPYYNDLSPAVSVPPGYAISIVPVLLEANKQEVTVSVSRGGVFVLKVKTQKTKWQI